jgi:uncharacterized membrane protein (DUF106 family)
MKTLIRIIELDYDLIEVHFNPLLKNKPYLIRVYNWNSQEPEELRLNKEEVENLYSVLKENNLI